MRTEKDIGSESPETTTVSGFFRTVFQSETQKISFPQNALWGGVEGNIRAFGDRFCDLFRSVCPFLFF